MILVDHQIKKFVESGALGIANFSDDCLQPATYDLRVGPSIYLPGEHPEKPVSLSQNGGSYSLAPYANVVLMTYETLAIPNKLIGRIGLKSGFARRGLFASTGPQIDPGFKGKLFVTVHNLSAVSYLIKYRDTFLSIEFHTLDETPQKLYDGPYQSREEIGPEIIEDLIRFEGVNLSQMQAQFTELLEHVKNWSQMSARFDEFLKTMKSHTEAINKLTEKFDIKERALDTIQTRKISLKNAMEEIASLFRQDKELFYSDIMEILNLDFDTVAKACEKLQQKGIIEGSENASK